MSASRFPLLRAASALVLALLLCTGCDPGADTRLRWEGTVAQHDGTPSVVNPDRPLLADDTALVRPLWSAPGGAAPDDVWQRPTRLALGPDRLYVLDEGAASVRPVTLDGRLLPPIGRKGGGPGEFESPGGLAFSGGALVVLDGGKAALQVMEPDGAPIRSLPLRGVAFSVWADDSGGLLLRGMDGGGDAWWRQGLDGTSRPVSLPGPPGPAPGGTACSRVEGAAGPYLAQASCVAPAFHLVDADGRVVRAVAVDRAPRRLTAGEEARVEQEIGRSVGQVGMAPDAAARLVRDLVADLRVKRSVRGIRRDAETGVYALWEQEPDETGGGPATLHLFSRGGVYLAAVPFPTPWTDFAVRGSRLYVLAEDPATGVVAPAAYQLRLPPRVLDHADDVAPFPH